MDQLTKSQIGRIAIRTFKTTADAMVLRGHFRPAGRSGTTLRESLKLLSPEIYGSMNDPRIIELKGLEYVIARLPRGIEECTRVTLTAEEELDHTAFEKIVPLKRRRTSYRVSNDEMSFIITRGMSEIYDILTHLTFLHIEALKIRDQIKDDTGDLSHEWKLLQKHCFTKNFDEESLDKAIWNLSIILGRTFHETRETFAELETNRRNHDSNNSLFNIVFNLGMGALHENDNSESSHIISFTPSLRELIGKHSYGRIWADNVKDRLSDPVYRGRPVHIISANMHSFINLIYGYSLLKKRNLPDDLYEFISSTKENGDEIRAHGEKNGLEYITDKSGSYIDCQIIDTSKLHDIDFHPSLNMKNTVPSEPEPVLLIMDYAFGEQAYEVMDELLSPPEPEDQDFSIDIKSISVMGKAGILTGKKGDIMLATAHVFEGTPHNYIVENDLKITDFDDSIDAYSGPIVTVLGTSLQNRDVLKRFHHTTWKAIGLEMEGGHYHRAINAAIIRGHVNEKIKVRYAYYASDNPLVSGQTLSSGDLGDEGIKPTYMISRLILEKILAT